MNHFLPCTTYKKLTPNESHRSKILDDDIGENLCELGIRERFCNTTTESRIYKRKKN